MQLLAQEYIDRRGPVTWEFWDDFNDLNLSATSGLAKWTMAETAAGATELLNLADALGVLALTQATNDNDVISMIANSGIKVESLYPGKPVKFAARWKVTDADDCDVHIGLGIHDTSYEASEPADWVGFQLLDGSAGLNIRARKDSSVSAQSSIATMADSTWARCFMDYFPSGTTDIGRLEYEIHTNGNVHRGVLDTNGNFPDDVVIFPFFQFQNGAAAADVFQIDWIYAKAWRAAYTEGTG